jgi:hypothetical protein
MKHRIGLLITTSVLTLAIILLAVVAFVYDHTTVFVGTLVVGPCLIAICVFQAIALCLKLKRLRDTASSDRETDLFLDAHALSREQI